ncbi:MAG: hypothetical protein RDV41_12570 [Planctomycetota bacterium]|nr:hypothetical protein [Planctomycetota bacterium]
MFGFLKRLIKRIFRCAAMSVAVVALLVGDSPQTFVRAEERQASFQVKGSFLRYEGRLVDFDDTSFRILTPDGLTVQFYWIELVDADAARMRASLGLRVTKAGEPDEAAPHPTEAGLKVTRLADKAEWYGKEEAGLSTPETVVIKSRGDRFSFRRAEVQIESLMLGIKDIYSEKELYELMLAGQVPRTAKEHLRVAELCSRYGLAGKAEEHYRFYELLSREDLPEGRLAGYVNKMRESFGDAQVKEQLYLMGVELMDEEYSKALDRLKTIERDFGEEELLNELKEVRKQIDLARQWSINTRIVESWRVILRSLLRTKATDRGARYSDCMEFAVHGVVVETAARVALRVGVEASPVKEIWQSRTSDSVETVDYGRGSWLVEASHLGDVEQWWDRASNAERFNILMGIHAEHNMRVRLKTHKNCPTCGGTGRVKPGGPPPVFPSKDQCTDCSGLGKSRVVIYW